MNHGCDMREEIMERVVISELGQTFLLQALETAKGLLVIRFDEGREPLIRILEISLSE
ncbi:MAG: hypothetical protein AAF514_13235 [Verrucomicrobiota bacterium]